jgi:hypothetical protein
VVLTASARKEIRARLSDADIVEAHRTAFEARQSVPALIESDDEFGVVRDLVGAQADQLTAFVNALASQSSGRWTEADWLGLARALEPAKDRWPGLKPSIVLRIAAILVTRQALRQAELWLDALPDVPTEDAQLDARRLCILSEIAKGGGTAASEAKMWRFVRSAERRLQEALEANPADRRLQQFLRDVRGNIARLELYFHHDAVMARTIFEGILDELNGEPEEDVVESLVAIKRNVAECLFEFEPFRSSEDKLVEARSHLVRAAGLARKHQLLALKAEALYSTAKLDECERDWQGARAHLEEAAESSRAAGHFVCLRIAEMRTFWLGVRHQGLAFDHALFVTRLRKLEFLQSHAWARRYAAQSRLWAAHLLDAAGDLSGVRVLLARNIAAFEPLTALSSNADRRLVALSQAGLAKCEAAASDGEARLAEGWTRFKMLGWAADWIMRQGADNPAEYWQGDA